MSSATYIYPQEITGSKLHYTDSVSASHSNQLRNGHFVNTPPVDMSFDSTRIGEFSFTDNDTLPVTDNYLDISDNPGIFKGHLLQPVVTAPLPLKKITPDWFTIVLFLTIGFFAWMKVINGKILRQLFAAFFNNSVTNQIVRDENIVIQRASVFLSLVFYFMAALFLYQASIKFNWDYKILGKGLVRFIIFVLFIASAYSIKMIVLKLLGIIFQTDRAISTYIFNIFLINNILGITLIPLVIIIAFVPGVSDIMIWTGTLMLAGAFIYRQFRGIIIWIGFSCFSFYYLILYLCALEIAPLLILFKLA